MKIAILGAGSWGMTLANVLAEKQWPVSLWEFNPEIANQFQKTRRSSFLPEFVLNSNVEVTSILSAAIENAKVIVSATPSQYVRLTMKQVKKTGKLIDTTPIVSVSKGLEEKTFKRMSEVIQEELGISSSRIAVLAGPNHAEEVSRQIPSATLIASPDIHLNKEMQSLFNNQYFRVYTHTDRLGVELGSVLKNVLAIACGIGDGLGFGDNTRAALLTRGLQEITLLGVAMGARMTTFFGLAGMGDLIVTCLSKHSRNRGFGEKIGLGKSPEQALSEMTMVVEGYKTAPSAYALVNQFNLRCPLLRETYSVLYEGKSPQKSLIDLMSRETQDEWQALADMDEKREK